jgi:hypothetical protein
MTPEIQDMLAYAAKNYDEPTMRALCRSPHTPAEVLVEILSLPAISEHCRGELVLNLNTPTWLVQELAATDESALVREVAAEALESRQ